MTLNLGVDLWYVRLFFSSLRVWRAFTGNPRYGDDEIPSAGTNPCFFVRVMVVYAPLVWLLHAALAAGAVLVLVMFPVSQFGIKSLAVGAGVVAVAWLLLAFHRWHPARPRTRRLARKSEPRGPSAWEILRVYAAAVKRRVCPLVTFREVPR